MKNEIGEKLRALRKSQGMTQGEFAEKVGFNRSTYAGYEIGRRTPSITDLKRIAAICGVTLDYFGVVLASKEEITDILTRSRKIFANESIPTEEKEELYKEIMRLYLTLSDNRGK